MTDERKHLVEIWEAIERIRPYAHRGREFFDSSDLLRTWIDNNLHRIREAVDALPPSVRERSPDVPWEKLVRLGKIMVQDHHGMDSGVILTMLERDLAEVKAAIERALTGSPRE